MIEQSPKLMNVVARMGRQAGVWNLGVRVTPMQMMPIKTIFTDCQCLSLTQIEIREMRTIVQ